MYDERSGKPLPDTLKQHFVVEGRIEESAALRIIKEGAAMLKAENTMIDIEAPVTGSYGKAYCVRRRLLSKICTKH